MDTQRLILFMLFTFSVFFLMDAWQKDRQPQPVAVSARVSGSASGPAATPVPTPTRQLTAAAPAAMPPAASGAMQKGETVRVETDVFVADIDTAGGDLRRLELLSHRDTLDHKKNFVLLQQEGEHIYVAQSGLIGNDLPNHRTRYTTGEREVRLAAGADRVSVRLSAPLADGLKVNKIYTFHRGSYAIDVGFEVENTSAASVQPDAYFQLVRDSQPPAGDSAMLPTYTGMAVYTDKEKFQKVAFTDIDKGKISYPKKSDDGWIAAALVFSTSKPTSIA
jgi:YidC/Oxa1 family membrane protein insertase